MIMKSKITSEVDVLIVGAGPIGLTTAIQLATHGIRNFRIIDKTIPPSLEQLTDFSRAVGIHARTLELLESTGLSSALIARGTLAHTASHFYNAEMMYQVTYASGCDKAHLRYPWNLMVTQGNTIDVFRNHLSKLGKEVEWQTSLANFEPASDYVTAALRNEYTGQIEHVRAKWLLGCDGAHSIVRKKLSIDFPGHVYPERWVVCDLNIDWDIPHNNIASFGSKDAYAIALPLAGQGNNRYRVTMIRPLEKHEPSSTKACPEERGMNFGEATGHALPMKQRRFTRAECEAFFQKIYPTAKVHCPDEAGNWFMVHCRLADRYRVGRCFLLGDAAHIHSPILGQGMNIGIQDATNLAWKLAAVLKAQSAESLLDTYEPERRAIANSVVKFTDMTTKLVTLRSRPLQQVRGFILRFLLSIPPTRRLLISRLMQLLMTYKGVPSVLNGEDWSPSWQERFRPAGPSVGDRCPDPLYINTPSEQKRLFESIRGNAYTLLLFEGLDKNGDLIRQRFWTVAQQLSRQYKALVQTRVILSGRTITPPFRNPADTLSHQDETQLLTIFDANALIHKAYGAYRPCVYVLRADRHIGYRGHIPEAVSDYLARIILPGRMGSQLRDTRKP